MRDGIVWILALVALPAGAAANSGQTGAAVEMLADSPSLSAAPEAAVAPSGLDLQIDQLPLPAPGAPDERGAIAPGAPERYLGAEPQAADRGLSFGLEVRRYRAADNLARAIEPDEPAGQRRAADRSLGSGPARQVSLLSRDRAPAVG